jgi:NADH-quinone oxidoreductase subunit L
MSPVQWVQSGALTFDWALRVDTLTAVMLVVVTTVSSARPPLFLGYMAEDPDQPRFFAYLSLFTFAMLMLVTATTSCRCSSAGKAWASPPTC